MNGPNASRKPGGELPYSSADKVAGGPLDNEIHEGLGADHEVSGGSSPKA